MNLTDRLVEPSSGTDAGLIARARAGDIAAFDQLIASRLSASLRVAQAILRSETDARDVTQDAFLSAWINLPRLRDEARFDAWLSQSIVNRCKDVLRRRGRVREIALAEEAASGRDPAVEAIQRTAVMAAFDRLSVADRQILALHHLDDRPLTEVARVLGIPVGTAKSRLHAARRALERALETQA